MKKSQIILLVVVLVVAAGAVYFLAGQGSPQNNQAATRPSNGIGLNGSPDQTNTGQQSAGPIVSAAHDDKLGDYLVAANGMTLYLYANDLPSISKCYDTCAESWPPYTVSANEPLVAGDGVTGDLATITRMDGSAQVTYRGRPLYFWKNDTKPGDTTGENVGGVWFVVNP